MRERVNWVPDGAFGITDEQAQEFETRQATGNWEHFTPEFVGVKAQTLDLQAALDQVSQGRKLYQEARLSQYEAEVRFRGDEPLTPFFIGDSHLGSLYTDHDAFIAQMVDIKKTPNAYVIWMSNLIDNAMPAQFPNNMLHNALPPDKQVVAMRKIIQELDGAGKVLGAVTSMCHEGWLYKHTGQDINALMFGYEGRKFPVLENGGILRLRFPSRVITIALYHNLGPFESNFNETHGVRQMNRLQHQMKADIVVGAHKHFAAAEVVYEGKGLDRKQVAYIRSGCYKGIGEVHDQFVVGKYGSTGEPGGQSVTILPATGNLDAHLDFRVGIMAQEAYLAHHFT